VRCAGLIFPVGFGYSSSERRWRGRRLVRIEIGLGFLDIRLIYLGEGE